MWCRSETCSLGLLSGFEKNKASGESIGASKVHGSVDKSTQRTRRNIPAANDAQDLLKG